MLAGADVAGVATGVTGRVVVDAEAGGADVPVTTGGVLC
jgi:hypothetical protein